MLATVKQTVWSAAVNSPLRAPRDSVNRRFQKTFTKIPDRLISAVFRLATAPNASATSHFGPSTRTFDADRMQPVASCRVRCRSKIASPGSGAIALYVSTNFPKGVRPGSAALLALALASAGCNGAGNGVASTPAPATAASDGDAPAPRPAAWWREAGDPVLSTLVQQGLETTVVEFAAHVLPPLEDELASLVTDELRRIGVDVRAGVAATAIETGAEHDVVVLGDGSRIDADLIVLSVGVRPDTAVFESAGVAAERVRNPARNIMRATMIGTVGPGLL